jgi:hypothetical protein
MLSLLYTPQKKTSRKETPDPSRHFGDKPERIKTKERKEEGSMQAACISEGGGGFFKRG